MRLRPLSHARQAVTLLEALAVLLIMGIAIFITLPHLAGNKSQGEQAAAKAKAVQLNLAKDSYISLVGIDTAQNNWTAAGDDNARFTLIKSHIAPATTVTQLNRTSGSTDGFSIPGYFLRFASSNFDHDGDSIYDLDGDLISDRDGTAITPRVSEYLIGAPVLLYKDVNLNGTFEAATDTQVNY